MPYRILNYAIALLLCSAVGACAGTRNARITLSRDLTNSNFQERGPAVAGIRPANLRCEASVNPLSIDNNPPVLSWALDPARPSLRDLAQSAYQILAASSEDALNGNRGDLWDTGKVTSKETIQIPYAGAALRSGMRVYWKVRVWDQHNRPSRYSRSACWEMGLLAPGDWAAQWIEADTSSANESADPFAEHPAPLLRKEFIAPKAVRRARVCHRPGLL